MAIVVKPLHRPFQTPYEGSVGDPSDGVYPNRAVTNGGLAFRLGRIRLELPGAQGAVIDRAVDYNYRLSKFRSWQGIKNGGIDSVHSGLPVFFHKPDAMDDVDVPVLANPVVRIGYEDFYAKHPDLARPYELTITLEYIEKCPEVEALADPAIRKRIYDDLALSGFQMLEIDTQQYIDNPEYSAALETAKRLEAESIIGGHRYIDQYVDYQGKQVKP